MRNGLLIAAGLVALAATTAGAQTPAKTRLVSVNTDSRLWLEGSSNIRDWTCKATKLDAQIELGPERGNDPVVTGAFVKVAVNTLKCGDRHMEEHMYKALKSAAHPFISAKLEALPCSQADTRTVDVTGTLTIAGVQKVIVIAVQGERLANGILHARGSLPILMTDYAMTPPRPWGGILRTANKVVIQFEIFVDPSKATPRGESLATR